MNKRKGLKNLLLFILSHVFLGNLLEDEYISSNNLVIIMSYPQASKMNFYNFARKTKRKL